MFLEYAWLIPALPFLAFLVILFLGLKTPEKGGWIALLLVGAAGLLSVGVFWDVWNGQLASWTAPFQQSITWFSVPRADPAAGSYVVTMGVHVDNLTAFMLLIVGILVTLIILYSLGYMHAEGSARRRYYAEMTLFITGMLGLVVANDYLMLFMFWEIMGLCSYLLIGYWYHKPSAASAAKKAFLVTRIGDAFFFAGLALLLWRFGSLEFDVLFSMPTVTGDDRSWLLIANVCLFLGAVGKSAQFPLHVWLPDAMEGPTTVSALIHAATMVKAGVYLVARSMPLFAQTPELLVVVAVIGGFTALFAASMALVNNDLKRVLAYSTLSQLGYMFLGLGVAGVLYQAHDMAVVAAVALGAVSVAVFHLFAHAFFKAGLFLSAGSVGHALHHHANPYDMRLMGGLRKVMPLTAFAMLMGTLSIAGFPFFSGFYSKDLLLESVYEAYHLGHNSVYLVLYIMGVVTALMTAFYMLRLYLMTFEGEYRWPRLRSKFEAAATGAGEHHGGHGPDAHDVHLKESPASMTTPLVILGSVAIGGGILLAAVFNGAPTGWLHVDPAVEARTGLTLDAHHLSVVDAILHPFFVPLTYVTLVAMAIGFGLAWAFYSPGRIETYLKTDAEYTGFAGVLYKRYRIDEVYDAFAERVVVGLAKVERWFDEKIVDGAVNGTAWVWTKAARVGRRMQTGNAQDYATIVVGGLMLVILVVIYTPRLPAIAGLFGGS